MTDASRLKRRVEYFLSTRVYGRREVAAFARAAGQRGSVFIVGGLLRDLYLGGNRPFCSDVDFIIEGCTAHDFDRFMTSFEGVPNRFGGYRVRLQKWSVEMWRLEDTWAHRAGHCSVNAVQDVAKATFFDWDAVFYDLENREVIAEPDYFARLRSRVLEVRLAQNPNMLGNVVRALRYASKWNALFGPSLARLVLREIVDSGWEALMTYEAASFRDQQLPFLDGAGIKRRLRRYDQTGHASNLRVCRRIFQPTLSLPIDESTSRQLALHL